MNQNDLLLFIDPHDVGVGSDGDRRVEKGPATRGASAAAGDRIAKGAKSSPSLLLLDYVTPQRARQHPAVGNDGRGQSMDTQQPPKPGTELASVLHADQLGDACGEGCC